MQIEENKTVDLPDENSGPATEIDITDPSNPNSSGVQRWEASDFITSSTTVKGGIGTDVIYQAGNSVTLTTGFHAERNNAFQAQL